MLLAPLPCRYIPSSPSSSILSRVAPSSSRYQPHFCPHELKLTRRLSRELPWWDHSSLDDVKDLPIAFIVETFQMSSKPSHRPQLKSSRRAPRLEDSLLENARSSIPLPVPRPVWVNPTNGNETLQLLYQSAYGAGRCQSRVVLLKMRLTMRVVRMEILYAKVTWYAALPPWTFRWSLSSVRRQNVGTFRGNPYSCCETDTSSELKS